MLVAAVPKPNPPDAAKQRDELLDQIERETADAVTRIAARLVSMEQTYLPARVRYRAALAALRKRPA